MAADPLRPSPTGMNWVFGEEVSVQVRVLKPSLPDGRIKWDRAGNARSSRWESDDTGFAAEVFRVGSLDLWVLHLQADKPAELGFRTSVASRTHPARPQGRRLLVSEAAGEPLFTWVFPMESDVERDGGAILLRGERGALVIVARGSGALAKVRRTGIEGDQVEDVKALLTTLQASRTGGPGDDPMPPPAAADQDEPEPDGIEVLPVGDEIDLLPEDE